MQSENPMSDALVTFNREQAISALGDAELLAEMAEIFLSEAHGLLERVQRCVADGDGTGLGQAAHQLKGAASNFYAERAVEAALRLEHMGRQNELGGSQQALATLVAEFERLRPELEKLAASSE